MSDRCFVWWNLNSTEGCGTMPRLGIEPPAGRWLPSTAVGRAVVVGLVTLSLAVPARSEEHTSELQSQSNLVCRLLLEKKTTDQHYHGVERVLGIGDGLAFGRLADQHFIAVGARADGGRRAVAFAVFDDARLAAFHNAH